jgi:hypothetical protein
MPKPQRIDVQDARQEVLFGRAKLVCAYEDREKCHQMLLEGSVPYSDFKSELPYLRPNQQIILYCA